MTNAAPSSTADGLAKTRGFWRCGTSVIVIGLMASSTAAIAAADAQEAVPEQVEPLAAPQPKDRADARLEYLLVQLDERIEAQDQRIAELEKKVDQQAYLIERQRADARAQYAETARLRLALAERGEWELIDRTNRPAPGVQHAMLAVTQDGAQDIPAPPADAPAQPVADNAIPEAERPQSDKAVDQLLLDQGGVLLPEGKLQIEPSLEYTSISNDRVNISGFSIFNAIVIGTIRVDDVNRDILTGAITARLGTGRRTQVDLRVPYTYRNDTEVTGIGTGDAAERRITGNGLGDIGLTVAWQPISAKGGRPATILRLQGEFPTGKSAFEIERIAPVENSPERILAEAPTGSGFYTASPGVTFVWPIDPVVLFAGGAYSYTAGRRFDDFGYIEPGHGFEFFAGLNMSINERVSMNFSFLDKQRFATKVEGVKLPGSGTHDARLSLGASIGLSDKISLVLSAANGLTDESPDFTFSVRLPIAF
ncbi:hypothetical protein [Altererythrobacter aquiaggeris]|uniref:hypothetical protein n=1 Tax=Aestuarierythrobacter aquiaggeris TaxID=1898396 RepID=UPI003018171A